MTKFALKAASAVITVVLGDSMALIVVGIRELGEVVVPETRAMGDLMVLALIVVVMAVVEEDNKVGNRILMGCVSKDPGDSLQRVIVVGGALDDARNWDSSPLT